MKNFKTILLICLMSNLTFAQTKSLATLEQERLEKVKIQLDILKNNPDGAKKQRALQNLERIGKEESLETIKSFLNDTQLSGPALRSLTAIYPFAKNQVQTVLLAELKKSASPSLDLLQALIQTNQVAAVPYLEKMYPSKDATINQMITSGLAKLKGTVAQKPLNFPAKPVLTGAALKTQTALDLLKSQKEKSLPIVWEMLKANDLDAIAVGIGLQSLSINDFIKTKISNYAALSHGQKCAVLLYASSRKWESVLPFVWQAIQSNSSQRLAGFLALPNLAKSQDFDLLAGKLGDLSQADEIKSVQTTLQNLVKNNVQFNGKLDVFAAKSAHPENYLMFLSQLQSLNLSYQIAKKSKSEEAIRVYVKLNQQVTNNTQQILNLRNAWALSTSMTLKEDILKQLLKSPSYQSLQVLKNGIKEIANKTVIAEGMANMFIANSDLQSQMTKEWMQEVMPFITTQTLRESLVKEFGKTNGKVGFYTMFNGKDLAGWKGLVDNPIKRAAMHPDTLAKKQKKADEVMRKGWYAKDGELHFTGHGDNLCSVKDYQDFEMYVDWKIEKDGDAGIYLRGSPQVQIWDIARVNVGANVGSGGLYNNQKNPSKPLKLVDNPIEEWNTFYIKMVGERVTVMLNGELVVDNVILENYWDRKLPIFIKDAIELQAHGNHIVYRDIFVKELEPQNLYKVSQEEANQGFQSLFDGQSLFQWTGNTTDYFPENGDLVINPKKGGKGNLYTKKEYDNFHLKFEFKLTPGANNGLGIRAPLEGDAAYVGMELQILDNTAKQYAELQPYQYHGSVYGIIPAKREFLKPVGEWNQEEVIAVGNHIRVILNGEIIVDGDIAEATKNGTPDHKEHPGLFNKTGHIGFLGHGSELRFRNLRILENPLVKKWKK